MDWSSSWALWLYVGYLRLIQSYNYQETKTELEKTQIYEAMNQIHDKYKSIRDQIMKIYIYWLQLTLGKWYGSKQHRTKCSHMYSSSQGEKVHQFF